MTGEAYDCAGRNTHQASAKTIPEQWTHYLASCAIHSDGVATAHSYSLLREVQRQAFVM